jgi:rhamnogalacturonyl hydrolase YesR
MGKRFADLQWQLPANAKPEYVELHNQGFTWQTRFWIDDMYMINLIQSEAYRMTGDTVYINRAAREMIEYLKRLQQSNGLFYHAPDVPFFWGRGNGWMAAGMTEILLSLPTNSVYRPAILKGYKTMMQSLLQFQSAGGMWRQLIDDSTAWPETSCTGMFTYAMITGVKKGWLSKKLYKPAAYKAWQALVSYINPDGDVREICEGTNKKNNRQFYLDRQRITGDMHGQAPVLWCAAAFLTN